MNITLRRNKTDSDMIEIITDVPPFLLSGKAYERVWAVVQSDFLEDEISEFMKEQDEAQVTLELHESETE